MLIIGITGTNGAGKGSIVEYLKTKGFEHYSARGFIYEEIDRRELERNRDNLIAAANELAEKYGPNHIAVQLFERAQKSGKDVVIESLRRPAEIISLREKGNFYMFAVDADRKTRYERNKGRKVDPDDVNFQKFVELEQKEYTNTDPNKQNLKKCIEMSDYKFVNNSTFEELYRQVDKVLEEIGFDKKN